MSQLPCSQQAGNPGERQHRTVDADEQLAILAVPAQADPAAHVALEGDADLAGADPRLINAAAVNRIMTSGPQTRARADRGSKPARAMSVVTRPTRPLHD